MADAIEQRRVQMGLSPSDFARAAGMTQQGLIPIRHGKRRDYRDKLRLGVARALLWPDDAVDRLLAGEDPATFETRQTPTEERLTRIERHVDAIGEAVKQLAATPPEPTDTLDALMAAARRYGQVVRTTENFDFDAHRAAELELLAAATDWAADQT
jgi:transcriptional regulator with XRE-family HTH domain